MKRLSISLLATGCVLACSAQKSRWKDYLYMRPLQGVENTWHSVVLTDSVFDRLQPSLSDIRILRVTGGDTAEVPYMLYEHRPASTLTGRDLKVINRTHGPGVYYYTLDLGEQAPATNLLSLDFGQENFDWRCSVEGSQDLIKWEIISADERILSISNEHTRYTFSRVHFPAVRFRYIRIGIHSGEKPLLRSVSANESVTHAGRPQQWPLKALHRSRNEEEKTSVAEAVLNQRVPLSSVRLHIADSLDYFRKLDISYVYDSVKTAQGVQLLYTEVFHGHVSSLEDNLFSFPGVVSNRLRIRVFDEDNEPLRLDSVQLFGNVHELIIRTPGKGSHFLLYGNEKARSPQYDLVNFKNTVPAQRTVLTLGKEQDRRREPARSKPFMESRWWLWGVMIAIIALIGVFSLRMLRSSKE